MLSRKKSLNENRGCIDTSDLSFSQIMFQCMSEPFLGILLHSTKPMVSVCNVCYDTHRILYIFDGCQTKGVVIKASPW